MALRDELPLHYRRVLRQISRPGCRFLFLHLARSHDGLCFDKRLPNPTIVIDPRGDVMETLVHETLHTVYPDWPEQRIGWVAKRITAQLGHSQMVRLWHRVTTRLVDTPTMFPHHLLLTTPPRIRAERQRTLRRAYRQVLHWLSYKPVTIGFYRLGEGTHGLCLLGELPNRPVLVIDPRRQVLDAVVHEVLHAIHLDWPEEQCDKTARDILRLLSHRQVVRLWRVIDGRLREQPPAVYDELLENPLPAAVPAEDRPFSAVG